MANVLVTGAEGGREQALAQAMALSPEVDRVEVRKNPEDGLASFRGDEKPFVVIGPEASLVKGLATELRNDGYTVLGASAQQAQYESKKSYATKVMIDAGIPHPDTYISYSRSSDEDYMSTYLPLEYVIKAEGLAGGKGVLLPETEEEAREFVDFLRGGGYDNAGQDVINFQKRRIGREVSAIALVGDNNDHFILPYTRDYKRIGEHDTGKNTGGMGAYGPVPDAAEWGAKVADLMANSLDGFSRYGVEYNRAVLYGGLIIPKLTGEPEVIEWNVRFGDPETQVQAALLTHLGIDVYRLLRSSAEGDLEKPNIDILNLGIIAMTTCLAAEGYPDKPVPGAIAYNLDRDLPEGTTLMKAAIDADNKVAGGRAAYVTSAANGNDVNEVADIIYAQIDMERVGPESGKIGFPNMQVRPDIAHHARSMS